VRLHTARCGQRRYPPTRVASTGDQRIIMLLVPPIPRAVGNVARLGFKLRQGRVGASTHTCRRRWAGGPAPRRGRRRAPAHARSPRAVCSPCVRGRQKLDGQSAPHYRRERWQSWQAATWCVRVAERRNAVEAGFCSAVRAADAGGRASGAQTRRRRARARRKTGVKYTRAEMKAEAGRERTASAWWRRR